jgi:hypothetical protein
MATDLLGQDKEHNALPLTGGLGYGMIDVQDFFYLGNKKNDFLFACYQKVTYLCRRIWNIAFLIKGGF